MATRDQETIALQQRTIRNQHLQIIALKEAVSDALSDVQLRDYQEGIRKLREIVLGREVEA